MSISLLTKLPSIISTKIVSQRSRKWLMSGTRIAVIQLSLLTPKCQAFSCIIRSISASCKKRRGVYPTACLSLTQVRLHSSNRSLKGVHLSPSFSTRATLESNESQIGLGCTLARRLSIYSCPFAYRTLLISTMPWSILVRPPASLC